MRRVREHVDHARGRAAIARLVHQQPGVARQRGRVAADVDDALRLGLQQSFNDGAIASLAGWIEQYNIWSGFELGKQFFDFSDLKCGVGNLVESGVVLGLFDGGGLNFYANCLSHFLG